MRWLLCSIRLDGLGEFTTVNIELAGQAGPRSLMTWAVISRKPAMFVSTRPVASPVDWVISVIALTNSDTRTMSVFSSAPMFSWAPLSTSCSIMLASRSRSNSVVVSERSIVCVSSISFTLDVAVSFDWAIAFCVTSLSSVNVRLTALVRSLARGIDHARDFGAVVHHRARKGETSFFDRLDGLVCGGRHFTREMIRLSR